MRRWNGPTVCLVDMLVSLVAAFLALAILIEEPTKAAEDPSQGEMTAYLFWDDNSNVDIDLWCRAPNDRPVGYSSRTSGHADLLRDDLGSRDDTSGKNFEEVHFRGLVGGEFVCNAHWYGNVAQLKEVPVRLIVQLHVAGGTAYNVATKNAVLTVQGQELTLARWRLDTDGRFVSGSVNELPLPLRAQ